MVLVKTTATMILHTPAAVENGDDVDLKYDRIEDDDSNADDDEFGVKQGKEKPNQVAFYFLFCNKIISYIYICYSRSDN